MTCHSYPQTHCGHSLFAIGISPDGSSVLCPRCVKQMAQARIKAETDLTGVPLGPRMDDTSVGLSLAQLADRARVPTPPMPPRSNSGNNARRKRVRKARADSNPNPTKVHTSSDDLELTPTPQYTSPHASPLSPADPQTQMDITPPLSQSFAAASQSQTSLDLLDSSQMKIDSDSSQSQSSAAPKKRKARRSPPATDRTLANMP